MRAKRIAALAATAFLAVSLLPASAQAVPTGATGLRHQVHTAGRVQVAPDALRYSWPGVYFEGRFFGTGVGVRLSDAAADYDVQIDGATVATLVTPGTTTYQVTGLARGTHRVRVVKRSESPWAVSEFGGFVAAPGGRILSAPDARRRQIEFIGDSYTAGYGNLSASRDCTGDEVHRTTNADVGFAALTARRLDADYQVNAFSGRGMVRNYGGGEPGTNYRTYYDRALLSVDGDRWHARNWRPQVVVVGLGINDFSTPVGEGEEWTQESLVTAYREAYHGFLDKLRARYGPRTLIVASATYVFNAPVYAETVERIVNERNATGDNRIRYWYYGNEGLDYGGCHWHPSANDHTIIADRLTAYLATQPLRW